MRLPHLSRLCAIALACASCSALAQVSGSVTLESDYRFRGVSPGEGRPSARLAVNYDADRGWYAGGSAANAAFAGGERYWQFTAYGGRVVPLTSTLNFDAGISAWHFNVSGLDFGEVYAGLLAREWSLRANYSPDYFHQHLGTLYVEAAAHRLITDTWRVFVHAGALTRVSAAPADHSDSPDYADYSYDEHRSPAPRRTRWDVRAGIGWTVTDQLDLQLAWTRASRSGPVPVTPQGVRGAFVASATWSF